MRMFAGAAAMALAGGLMMTNADEGMWLFNDPPRALDRLCRMMGW